MAVEETSGGIRLRQNRFLSSGDPTHEEDATIWTIPLNIKVFGTAGEPTKVLMSERELLLPSLDDAFSLNAKTSGLCTLAVWLSTCQLAADLNSIYSPRLLPAFSSCEARCRSRKG